MKTNKLIIYKNSIFARITKFFNKIFFGKKDKAEVIDIVSIYNEQNKKQFLKNIEVKESEEETRLQLLKQQYDNGTIDEEDILEEDMDKLIEMYKKETIELNEDTLRRKEYIAQMLKQLKNA